MRTLASLALALALAGCGTDAEAPPPGGGSGSGTGSGSNGMYTTLVSADWSLDGQSEKYLCVRKTVTTDTYISAIAPIAPLGTHHTVLMVGTPSGPDGITECDSSLIKPAIYASGVGTQPLQLPDGIAIHLKPGDQILLNLHLFNANEDTLTGTSGMNIIPIDASAVEHEAGVLLAGKMAGLVVNPGASEQVGTCSTPNGYTVFAAAPHMHLLGTHLSAIYTPPGSGTPTTLIDQDYSFDQQRYVMLPQQLDTVTGGKLTVTCSYMNPTPDPVYFGESTTDEMCFSLTMVYPPPAADTCTK